MRRIESVEIEEWLNRLYIATEGAGLRKEDLRKACEVAAILEEVERGIGTFSKRSPIILVDAAAGKSYVGLLAAKLLLEGIGRPARVIAIERDTKRVQASMIALERLGTAVPVEFRHEDVESDGVWPQSPSIVTALHACGPAADAIISQAIAARARRILLAPCCTSSAVPAASRALELAREAGIPPHAPVRRRFIQAVVDAERTWRLEAAGYQTEVVEFVPPTVTPHNLLWRARLVGEKQRMKNAARALEQITGAR